MPGTVTVACKLPNGLVLQTFRMEEHDEPMFGGGTKRIKRAVLAQGPVKLNGSARFKGRDMPHDIRHGAGLTYGVDADFFAEWQKQNKDADYAKFVFAQSAKPGETEAQAKELAGLKTGLEPIDPNNLPPEFRDIKPIDGAK